jgi:hypothetical protein
MPPKEPIAKTYRLVKEKVSEESLETKEVQTTPSGAQVEQLHVPAV